MSFTTSTGFVAEDYQRIIDTHQGTGEEIEYWNDSKTGKTLLVIIYSHLRFWK